ncbi:pentatricopeptide repeat-containing protein At5g16640, mitochondrial-like [Manihot esculenta]|uniref:pentatricopeptide repeat-containing protein At5g16640, mitochondrial-like n=1 Tax=Manihot esculenta TaxID=3983 RepID=UPI001CC7B8EC|nr:pentatricopeptide repeat-containing protein At5g16640, mitochondrial-like [Manihot esculenta]
MYFYKCKRFQKLYHFLHITLSIVTKNCSCSDDVVLPFQRLVVLLVGFYCKVFVLPKSSTLFELLSFRDTLCAHCLGLQRSMMMITPKLRFTKALSLASAIRSFHFPLLWELGNIQSPTLLFTYPFNSSSTSTSTHTHKDASVRSKFYSASFRDVDDALASFNHIILMHPLPSRVPFSRFLSALVRMKQYHTVVSLSRKIESLGMSHDVCSLNILINCFCLLHHADFGFSTLGKILKIGLEPNIVTFNILINGLCINGKINLAVYLFNDMVASGYQPDVLAM